MTITLPLQPQEEAKLIAIAYAKGVSADALVREALDRILAEAANVAGDVPSGAATGAVLIAAMQASPYPEIDLVAAGERLPVRGLAL